MIKSIKAVIFDMDGVLINSEPIHNEAWIKIFNQYNIEISQEELRQFAGVNANYIGSYLEEKNRIKPRMRQQLISEKRTIYNEAIETQLKLMPNIDKLLNYLKDKNYPLSIASSSSQSQIDDALRITKIGHFFQHTTSRNDVINAKPDPEIFLLAAKKIKIDPKYILAIEDSTYGIIAAKRANMKVIGYVSSYSAEKLAKTGADVVVSSHQQIIEIFEKEENE